MRILITGTDGYIGCLMAPFISGHGHEVVGLDTRYFREARLGCDLDSSFPTISKDLRQVERRDLEGFDAVIHLAGLSNDALGQISRQVTYDVNHHASTRLATLAKDVGVARFVYSSSCSVYGRSHEQVVTETTQLNPQTDYAVCKMLDEREIAALADDRFSPTFLRNATAYGASPRMRFDLVVNNLAGIAWTAGRIAMTSAHARHLWRVSGGVGRAARRHSQRDLQRREHPRELSDPRNRGLSRQRVPGLRDQLWRERP
jgi:nucleoside-diphosphate-sugar epimerase